MSKINSKYKTYGILDPSIMSSFQKYSWPGNIRELEHVLERLVLTVDNDIISEKYLPPNIQQANNDSLPEKEPEKTKPTSSSGKSYKEIEIEKILSLYEELHSSYKVAERLNISQSKATRIINKYKKQK